MANVYVRSGASGANNGTSKTDAYTTLAAALTGSAAGDVIYVASDHAESQASAMTLTPPGTAASPNQILCVNFAGSTPPVAADLTTGGSITTTGSFGITMAGGYAYWRGLTFNCGTGSTAFAILSTAGGYVFDTCELLMGNTGSSSTFQIGAGAGANALRCEMVNTTLGFQHVSQFISVRCARVIWRDSATPLKSGGAYVVPTNLFSTSNRTGTVRIEALDLSLMGSGKTIVGTNNDPCEFWIKDCKLHASVTVATTPSAPGTAETYMTRCDSSGTSYRAEKYAYQGKETTETTIVRTGGASDGATGFSARIETTANAEWMTPFEGLPLAAYNGTVGSSVTVTVEGIWNAAAVPTNADVWIDVEGLSTSGSPLGDFVTSGRATILTTASNLTASTEAWDSVAATRANSTAYSLGDVVKVGSNAGRLFFCTTAGTSNASLPAGYASAVDGGTVSDGTAVFRAGVRFKMSASLTPQIAGVVYAYPKAAVVSSVLYLDRKITLS